MTEYPLVIACLPVYQAEAFLEATLLSLAAQTYPNLKILISDDASTDATVAICQQWVNKDSRFDLIQQSQRLGWIGNSNALLMAAKKAHYLFFSAHDDILHPNYVSYLVDKLQDSPQAILAFSDMNYENTAHHKVIKAIKTYQELEYIQDSYGRAQVVISLKGDWWVAYRGIFRIRAVEEIRGLKKHFAGEFAADWSWLLHMSILGEFARVPQVLYYKNHSKNSLSVSMWKYTFRQWLGVSLSCAQIIYHSEQISYIHKLSLYYLLLKNCGYWGFKSLKSRWKSWKSNTMLSQKN